MTRILQTDLARDALYTKVNQIADEKQDVLTAGTCISIDTENDNTISVNASTDANLGNSDTVVPSQKAVKTYVDNGLSAKANDSTVVHNTGNESISGTKTFTETTSGANLVQSTSATATGSYVDFVQQINGSRRGTIRTTYNSDGSYSIALGCNGPDAAAPTGVIVKRTSTTTTVTVPTPATSDNSTQIATTAFVKAQGYATSSSLISDYVNLTSNQNVDGIKTFLKEINVKESNPNVNLKNSDVTKGTNPSGEKQSTIYFDDKDGATMGMIRYHVNSSGDTWMSLRSYPNIASQTSNDAGVYIRRYNDGTRFFYPTTASIVSLGKSDVRWKQIYCDTSTISTSDERLKQNIEELPDEVLEAWGEVEFYRFKFKSSVSEKGLENARYHTGVVAQRIKSIFEKHNLNASDYGLFCYDEWDCEPEERDEKGDIISPERPAGNEYSIRYEECLCMEAAYQRWRADKIEERLRRLEERL